MITTITGNNSFALQKRLQELTNGFAKENGELAVEKYDAEEAESGKIMEALAALPFLSPGKMVVVRSGSLNKDIAEQVEQIISSIPESTEAVFYEPLTDKRTSFYKTLKSKTQFEEYNQMSSAELAKWLVLEAKRSGGKLSFTDANYLVERLGENQEMLANELDKLLLYKPEITRQTIDELTEETPQSKVFELINAAFSDNKARALKLYEDQRRQKVEPQIILAMIIWQLGLLTLAKLGEGRSSDQIAKDSGTNSFPISRAVGLVKKIDRNRLEQMVQQAFEIDFKAKTKYIDLDEALKAYIVSL